MFKIFSMFGHRLPVSLEPEEQTPDWLCDPLAHPDIAVMDARTLGDLPFGLFRAEAASERPCGRPAVCEVSTGA